MNQEDIEKMNNWKTKVIDTFNTYANALSRSNKKDNTSELFDILFDDTAENDIREEILVNMAYIIDCSILESYRTDYNAKLFDEIYYNILDVYFKRYSCIELTKNDRRIIAGIILTILNRLHKKSICRNLVFDDLYIENEKEDNDPLYTILQQYIKDTNTDNCNMNCIRRSIENIIEVIMNKMNYLALVFTNLYCNNLLFSDIYELRSTRIISISPLSFNYDKKLQHLTHILIGHYDKCGSPICSKYDDAYKDQSK